jgi:PAS domain S-box-containing protein
MRKLLSELEHLREGREDGPGEQLRTLAEQALIVAALDALPMQIAIVAEDGTILAVNGRWSRFAIENGGAPDTCGGGVNYLDACRRAAAAGDATAAAFAEAFPRLLLGELPAFEIQYACHSPHEPRWFVARLAPFMVGEERCVLVTHENVTQRLMSRATIDVLAVVAARTANGVMITDARGRIEWVNDAFVTMTGWSRDEAMGRKPGALLQREGSAGPSLEALRAALHARRPAVVTLLNYRRDGTPFYVELRVEPVFDDAGELRGFVGVHIDATEKLQYERHAEEAARLERERIAGDLHDGLGQELTGARLLLAVARRTLAPGHAGEAMLDRAAEALNAAAASARVLARGLAPADCAPGGLAAQLDALARRMSVEGVVDVSCDADPSIAMPATAAEHLLRIAQESVANAIRHGAARHVCVKFSHGDGVARLQVEDDGRGFDPSSASSGLGLALMRHRAAELHGALRIAAAPGSGATIDCSIPCELSAPSAART